MLDGYDGETTIRNDANIEVQHRKARSSSYPLRMAIGAAGRLDTLAAWASARVEMSRRRDDMFHVNYRQTDQGPMHNKTGGKDNNLDGGFVACD